MEWDQKKFGMRLKAMRRDFGYSMLAFGKEIGTSASRIKNWEEGKSVPSASWIVKISERFGVSVDELLKGEEKMNPAMMVMEDSVDPYFTLISEESPAYYDVGNRKEIDELASLIDDWGRRKYAGTDGRGELIYGITECLPELSNRDLFELRTLAQLKARTK